MHCSAGLDIPEGAPNVLFLSKNTFFLLPKLCSLIKQSNYTLQLLTAVTVLYNPDLSM